MKKKTNSIKGLVLIAVVSMTMIQCRDYQYFPDMHYSPAIDSQKEDLIGKRQGAREIPAGVIAYNKEEPYVAGNFRDDLALADRTVVSPYAGNNEKIAELTQKGQNKFRIFCSPCHGLDGGTYNAGGLNRGSGSVAKVWGAIPSLYGPGYIGKDRKDYSVGAIYHIVTRGIQSMQGYASQMNPEERWSVAYYVKKLQQEYTAK